MSPRCLVVLLASSFTLSGCVASIAASAVGAAIQASQPEEVTEDLRQPAIAACTLRAAEQGEVHIIDSQQRPGGRVIVWGTAEAPGKRQAFECRWRGGIRDFDLRTLPLRTRVQDPSHSQAREDDAPVH